MIEFHDTPLVCYRCRASSWEIIGERKLREKTRTIWQDVIECVFCGVIEAVEASPRRTEKSVNLTDSSAFRFQYGRFAGKTLAEADAEPNGRRYLEHMRDTNDRLRDTIAQYLTNAAPSATSGPRHPAALAAAP